MVTKQDRHHRQDRHNKQDNRDKVIKTIYEIVSFAISKRYVDFFTINFHPVRYHLTDRIYRTDMTGGRDRTDLKI